LPETGIVRKVRFLRVFEDQQPSAAQAVAFERQPYDLFAALQIVGGVGKHDIELLVAVFQVEERVRLDGVEAADAQLRGRLPDEVVVHRVDLHGRDAAGSPRGELVADRAGPGEEVQYVALLEIHEVSQHVEEVLLGEVRRRTRSEVAGRIDRPALVFAADYSHTTFLNRFPSNLRSAFGSSPAARSV